MSFKKLILCSLASTLAPILTTHTMSNQKTCPLHDYTTFKHVHAIATDIGEILLKYDIKHNMSIYGIDHSAERSESGIFWMERKYGSCDTYFLKTPWGDFFLARIEGKFVEDEETKMRHTKGILRTKEISRILTMPNLSCNGQIKAYFNTNFGSDESAPKEVSVPKPLNSIIKLYALTKFKDTSLTTATAPTEKSSINKADLASAWDTLKAKYHDEMKELERQQLKKLQKNDPSEAFKVMIKNKAMIKNVELQQWELKELPIKELKKQPSEAESHKAFLLKRLQNIK